MTQLAMTETACTPSQLHIAHVLGELADRIDASLTRPIQSDQAVSGSGLIFQHFLRDFCLTTGMLSERIIHLSQRVGLLAGTDHDSTPLPALLDDIDRQTWYFLRQVESFLCKRFGSPYYELRPYVAALGEKTLADVRDLYRQLASDCSDPAAQVDVVMAAMRIKREVNAKGERLMKQIKLLGTGNRFNTSDELGTVPSLSRRRPKARPPSADTGLLNLWPVLGYTLGGLALVVSVYHFWPVFLGFGLVLLGLAVLGLIFKYPWAFIIAMLLG